MAQVQAWADAVQAAGLAGVTDVVPGYVSGLNAAGRVKVRLVLSIRLNRDRANVSTRALALFIASAYQFP